MRQWIERLVAHRRQAVALYLLAGTVFSIWIGVERDLVLGITIFMSLFGLPAFFLQFLPVKPKLAIKPSATSDQSAVIVHPDLVVRPIDIEQIVQSSRKAALSKMPPRPAPRVPANSPLAKFVDTQRKAALFALPPGVTERDLHAFEKEVDDFCDELRQWLEQLQERRAEYLRRFSAQVAVCEAGHAPAKNIRFRLRFPAGFEPDDFPDFLPDRPKQPEWNSLRSPYPGVSLSDITNLVHPEPTDVRSTFGSRAPQYSMDGNNPVITYELEYLNQSEGLDMQHFDLRAPSPGDYQVEWELHADDLAEPETGILVFTICAPQNSDEAIQDLQQADDEQERYEL